MGKTITKVSFKSAGEAGVENEGESAYPFIAELLADVELVKDEAEEYLKGKYGLKQGNLFEEPEAAEVDE